MPGDWIKWTKGLARKPEVIRIASILGKTRHEVAALLMEVWEWADDNVSVVEVSGSQPDTWPGEVCLGASPCSQLDALTATPGLADAMSAVGWLHARYGSLAFPNFARHSGKTAKDRALDALRKRIARGRQDEDDARAPKKVQEPDDRSARQEENPDSVREMSGSQPDKKRTREEKRREDINTLPAYAGPASAPKAERPRNALWDVVCECFHLNPQTRSECSRVGKVTRDLKAKGATPGEVQARLARYRQRWPDMEATPEALLKHWDLFAAAAGEDASRQERSRAQMEELRTIREQAAPPEEVKKVLERTKGGDKP